MAPPQGGEDGFSFCIGFNMTFLRLLRILILTMMWWLILLEHVPYHLLLAWHMPLRIEHGNHPCMLHSSLHATRVDFFCVGNDHSIGIGTTINLLHLMFWSSRKKNPADTIDQWPMKTRNNQTNILKAQSMLSFLRVFRGFLGLGLDRPRGPTVGVRGLEVMDEVIALRGSNFTTVKEGVREFVVTKRCQQ